MRCIFLPEPKLEEICIGHLFLAGDSEKDKYAVNGKLLGIPNCDFCIADEKNRQCIWYRPVRLHIYNVLPKEENPSQ